MADEITPLAELLGEDVEPDDDPAMSDLAMVVNGCRNDAGDAPFFAPFFAPPKPRRELAGASRLLSLEAAPLTADAFSGGDFFSGISPPPSSARPRVNRGLGRSESGQLLGRNMGRLAKNGMMKARRRQCNL